MPRPDFATACTFTPLRFTMEHVPPWASAPLPGGPPAAYPAPQFRSDQEWYDHTRFPEEYTAEERKAFGPNHRYTTGETWPLGQTLPAPYVPVAP